MLNFLITCWVLRKTKDKKYQLAVLTKKKSIFEEIATNVENNQTFEILGSIRSDIFEFLVGK